MQIKIKIMQIYTEIQQIDENKMEKIRNAPFYICLSIFNSYKNQVRVYVF